MNYKDLIYKITSTNVTVQDMKKDTPDINSAKASVQTKDVLIGILSDDKVILTPGILNAIKNDIERKLTVLFNSPISDSFSFLPYSENTLKIMVDVFPDRNFHYISEKEELTNINELKKNKLNIKMVYTTTNKNQEFVEKIDYLVTINKEVEPTMKSFLDKKNVMIFPLTFVGTQNTSQPEKLILPDPSGLVYNSASGMWTKNWGWDGFQSLDSWKAPADWNLNPNPDQNTGA